MTNPELAVAAKDLMIPSTFDFGPVPIAPPTPTLGPLSAFTGTFTTRPDTNGFNTIFRPNLGSPITPPIPPIGPNDNVLELNFTTETLSFSAPLGAVPNRGEVQPDIFLNGVPYVQAITDVTTFMITNNPSDKTGIHLEPGLWMSVPSTTDPEEPSTLVRMASIPHGTTICAQGISQPPVAGPPDIFTASITPNIGPFPSQTAGDNNTWRIPQDLGPYLAAGTITQEILDNPNKLLSNAIQGQNITSTTTISVSTTTGEPLFGGGTDNIAFLLGDASATAPNAQTTCMAATFWVETVEHVVLVPIFTPGQQPLKLPPENVDPAAAPTFVIDPPIPIIEPRRITVTSTQIQYSQTVVLNFNGILWPHVSVATLIPEAPVTIPPAAWFVERR